MRRELLAMVAITWASGFAACGKADPEPAAGGGSVPSTADAADATGAESGVTLRHAPVAPTHRRDCIMARLAALDGGAAMALDGGATTAHLAALDAGAATDPIGAYTAAVDSGSSATGDGGVDLQLGAGDLTLLLVFDKSGSMAAPWDSRTKWQVANEALMSAIEPVIDNLTLATLFFPQPSECDVAPLDQPPQMSYMPGRTFMAAWRQTEGERGPDGLTPLELAMRRADQAIERACGLGLLDERFRVVLITDGEPTCDDDTNAVTALAGEWSRLGVETIVMGLPGSEGAVRLLDDIAAAGGTGTAQLLGTPRALDEALGAAVR